MEKMKFKSATLQGWTLQRGYISTLFCFDEGGKAEDVGEGGGIEEGTGVQAGVDDSVLGTGVGHAIDGSADHFVAIGLDGGGQ